MKMIDALTLVKQHDFIVEDNQRSEQICCEESLNVLVVSVSVVLRHYSVTTCYIICRVNQNISLTNGINHRNHLTMLAGQDGK